MTAYYNEFDPFAAQWLRELIKAGAIAPGEVDDRSIVDVKPEDIKGFTQCHFFAGIGVWSHALRNAGWSDDRPVWTGSPPCQPFSSAGKRKGFEDERHLWPVFYNLLRECRPANFFGEQVASKDALAWLDPVHADMERAGYAFGAVDLCAAGVGAPHIRQRLFMCGSRHLADTDDEGLERYRKSGNLQVPLGRQRAERHIGAADSPSGMDDAENDRHERCGQLNQSPRRDGASHSGTDHGLADTDGNGSSDGVDTSNGRAAATGSQHRRDMYASPTNGFWGNPDWLGCRDGKWRSVESGTFPLAHGTPARVGRLRGYGNAIVAPLAQVFIEAYLETETTDVRPVTYDI